MKKLILLTKTLLVAVLLMVGANAWADKEYTTVFSQDYQDAETFSSGWTNSNSDRMGITQATREGDSKCISLAWLNVTKNNGTNGYVTNYFTNALYTGSKDYKIEFDFSMATNNTGTGYPSLVLTLGSNTITFTPTAASYVNTLATPITSNINYYDASTSTTTKLGEFTSSTSLRYFTPGETVSPYWYKVTILSNETDGTSLTVTSCSNPAETATYELSDDMLYVSRMQFNTGKSYTAVAIDDFSVGVYSDTEVVPNPTATVTGVNGTERTITLSLGTGSKDGTTMAYSTNSDMSESTAYSAPFTVSSAGTIYFQSTSPTSAKSEIQSISVTCEAVKLGTPTIMRTGAKTYTISPITTTTDGFTADQTIHYTIGGGAEQTGTSLTNVNGDIVAWATATGFTTSDNLEMTYVKAYELASDATWSYNLNSYPSAHTCTAIGNALSATSKEIQSTTMYNLKEEDYPNLYIENGTGWLLRNQGASAWKCQSAVQSIGFDNVTTTDVIYIHAVRDGGGNAINTVYGGTVKYSYSNNYYYIVPTEDGSVKVAFYIGTALNTVGVYKQVVSATIGSYGWATFSSDYALDFSKATEGLEAYMITGHDGTVVTKSQVTGTVPAGTGLLLKGDEGNYTIPVVASSSTDVSANKLVAGTGASVSKEENMTKYVLGVNGENAEFQKIDGTPATVDKGKAYLVFNGEILARTMRFSGDITGVENVEAAAEAKAKEGKFIENGKLVIVKNGQKFNAAGAQVK